MVERAALADYSLQNIAHARLAIRKDLLWTSQTYSDVDCYLISDPLTSANYRVGIPEHAFITALEQGLTVGEALRQTASSWEMNAFTEHEAVRIVQWLIEEGLATTRTSSAPSYLQRRREQNRKPILEKLNFITFRLPISYPDKFYTAIYPYFAWIFGGMFLVVWVCVVLYAGFLVTLNFDRFQLDAARVFSPQNILWLALIWVLLKFIHESAHALMCKRYGGRIYEIGVFFILFIPLAYVDVSSMWRFKSKWHRMHVAAAGMYIELFIGALAAIVWCFGEQSSLSYLAHNTVIVASVGTLLFNANALMRFDGYHLLSDFVEIPNLYTRGQARLLNIAKRTLAPADNLNAKTNEPKQGFIVGYAVAALCWRIFVLALLIYLSTRLFHGFGTILAIFAVISWFILPLIRASKYLGAGLRDGRVSPRVLLVATMMFSVSAVGFLTLPVSFSQMVPGYAVYDDPISVRTESHGFVSEVMIEPYSLVERGTPLLRMENGELENSLAEVNAELATVQIKRNAAINQKLVAEDASLATHYNVLAKKKAEIEKEIRGQTVVAKQAGLLIAMNLKELEGQFLAKGTEIGIIVDESKKVINAYVDTRHSKVTQEIESDITVMPESAVLARFAGQILDTKPRVLHELEFIGVTALGGGTLPLANGESVSQTTANQNAPVRLLSPVVEVSISIEASAAKQLYDGQRVRVKLSRLEEPLGTQLGRQISKLFQFRAY